MQRRVFGPFVAMALAVAACSSSGDGADQNDDAAVTTPTDAPTTDPATDPEPEPTTVDEPEPEPEPAVIELDVRAGVEQITLNGATPGTTIDVMAGDDTVASGAVDDFGTFIARGLDADLDHRLRTDDGVTEPIDVLARDEHPDPAFYAEQRLPAPGFGYLETRDGTLLSVNVVLPGPAEDGPYPTVVEYSGYSVSNPNGGGFKDLFPPLGYAYVAVNMRGSGCSGGSFRFFEYTQSTDGYDVIEAVAAQPWALNNRAGMVGISYPGISQLFVAQTQPPSLAAITPLSVLDDSYQGNLYPGGILNTGFAVEWTQDRLDDGRPAIDPSGELTDEGQGWVTDQILAGDEVCAANQSERLQNPDVVAEIMDTPYYTTELGDEIAPRTFVDQIEVPTFMSGAWQDEQTGGRFPTMIPEFTGTDQLYVSLLNGLHTESISPAVFPRLIEFLELYVAERTPDLTTTRLVAPILAEGIFGTSDFVLPTDRFAGMEYADALAAFEAEPSIEILFEQGASDGAPPLTPLARYTAGFDEWPIPGTVATPFHLGLDGNLLEQPETTDGSIEYLALPDGVPATFWDGNSSDLWRTDVVWDWQEPAPGTFADFVSAPLADTLVMIGSASADLWVSSNLGDTDLEVTLTEIRPDGNEVMVQSGWLRASHRALLDDESSELRPVRSYLEADLAPLPDPDGDDPAFSLARVEILPFAHTFRAGSQIQLMVDAPGGNRATWVFDTISGGERVEIGVGPDFPSRLVLPVVPGVDAPETYPACDSLKGQPCRPTGES
ncbi:CocE/NonD family hydrolase [Ilumatobacter coccineus]|uniref:Peptidase S15 family protein n=1 Tax=Ilumatobacter coccineus (strain NBRC 103263 / KCTC 29153 / YM16-304) TaxID=1313172 RepID=A0A6C7EAJ1_ILUCY|nr:CocE/NonD family hydrolase [Ilumatobacter coccineus]BAN03400.1 peptidase S15 family protein [Ilumatobacter coccineus YM16-304]